MRQEGLEAVVLLLSPIVPHVTHALWRALGHAEAVIDARWPVADPRALAQERVEIVVQVNGKLRGRIAVPAGASADETAEAALADQAVQRHVEGKRVRKTIYVPGKLINLVV